ncbi:MAG: hypothetical protein Tsb0020_08240 [Haliangiales bacterium]
MIADTSVRRADSDRRRDLISQTLAGMNVRASGGPQVARDTCLHYLNLLGADIIAVDRGGLSGRARQRGEVWLGPKRGLTTVPSVGGLDQRLGPGGEVRCELSWLGRVCEEQGLLGSEAVVQALSGIMDLHGRAQERPYHLEVALCSYTAGLLSAQALLAQLLAQLRGVEVASATSVLHAGLLFMTHYAAFSSSERGSTDAGDASDGEDGGRQGPPFLTADGHWVEVETLSGVVWHDFWVSLGVDAELAKGLWNRYRMRYSTGSCYLPPPMWDAVSKKSLAELTALAQAAGSELCRIRHHDEQHRELGPEGDEYRPWTMRALDPRSGGEWPKAGSASAMSPQDGPALPLRGFKVVEATKLIQGPLTGFLLRALGAEVIHIEPPGGLMVHESDPRDVGSYSMTFNRNKDIRELDLKSPAGRAEFIDEVADADVVLYNWRDHTADSLGLGYETLAARNPRLVYAHARGWGDRQPAEHQLATDALVQAYAGFGSLICGEQPNPAPSRVVLDVLGGIQMSLGIMAALCLRERRGGLGCRVDTSLYDAALSLQTKAINGLVDGIHRGQQPVEEHNALVRLVDQPLDTADGYLAIGLDDDDGRAWETLCRVCEVATEGRSVSEIEATLSERFRSMSAAHWAARLTAAGLSAARVCMRPCELAEDSRFTHLFERERSSWMHRAPWDF